MRPSLKPVTDATPWAHESCYFWHSDGLPKIAVTAIVCLSHHLLSLWRVVSSWPSVWFHFLGQDLAPQKAYCLHVNFSVPNYPMTSTTTFLKAFAKPLTVSIYLPLWRPEKAKLVISMDIYSFFGLFSSFPLPAPCWKEATHEILRWSLSFQPKDWRKKWYFNQSSLFFFFKITNIW